MYINIITLEKLRVIITFMNVFCYGLILGRYKRVLSDFVSLLYLSLFKRFSELKENQNKTTEVITMVKTIKEWSIECLKGFDNDYIKAENYLLHILQNNDFQNNTAGLKLNQGMYYLIHNKLLEV